MDSTNSPKKYFWVLLDVLIALIAVWVLALIITVIPAIRRFSDSIQPVRTMAAAAEGKATVAPDVAVVSFSVVSQGKNPENLSQSNNQKISAADEFVKSQGIDAKDIQTTGYNLAPDYQYDKNTQRNFIVGYTLTQTLTVKVRDLTKVAKVIRGLTPLGINQIGGINFSIDDREKALAGARADAFQKARIKAQAMAVENGLTLGRLINISENGNAPPIRYYEKAEFSAPMSLGSAAPTIEPGSQEVTVQVILTYELK